MTRNSNAPRRSSLPHTHPNSMQRSQRASVNRSSPDEWIASQDADVFEGLDPVVCFEAWRNAWARTAVEIMIPRIAEKRSRMCPVCHGIERGHTCCP